MKTETSKNPTIQPLLSQLIMVIGILLMVFKIYADSEPGAIPLLLIIVGAIWYFFTRILQRAKSKI